MLLVRVPIPREKGTIGAGQSLFSLTAFSGSSYLSAERFLERDAETSSDTECDVSIMTSHCHPELVSGSLFFSSQRMEDRWQTT